MLGIGDRPLGPRSGMDITSLLATLQQVHRYHGELQGRTSLQKQHIKLIGHAIHRSHKIDSLFMDGDKMLAPVTHFDQRHAGAVVVHELGLTLFQN